MKRSPLFLFLLPLSITACAATVAPAATDEFRFTLEERGGRESIHARFFPTRAMGKDSHWSTDLRTAELDGLDLSALRANGANELRFALNRDSGRLDCAGSGGRSSASGHCRFGASPAFAAALAQAGIRATGNDDWLSLFALDVRRDLIDAVRAAGYPPPSVDTLIEMTAVGVDAAYIRALAAAGYRPQKLDTLVELRAVGVTPEWIGSLSRSGYAGLGVDDLVQLRALGVDGDYVRGFQALGYRDLTADQLVEMKALGVTADFARRVEASFGRQSPSRLVEMRALGLDPDRR